MAIKKVCETGEFWGAKYNNCNYEFEQEDREIFEYLKKEIENGMDYIPDEIEYNTYNCLNDGCSEWKDLSFFINPTHYLNNKEIKDLEDLINKLYGEEE